jgi:altronate hydrolase
MASFELSVTFGSEARETDILPVANRATFDGYRYTSGAVGTRNYMGIVTSVNCSASAAKLLTTEAERSGLLDACPAVDGIIPIVQGAGGCIGTDDDVYGRPRDESFQDYTPQSAGDTRKSIEKRLVWLETALQTAAESQRKAIDASHLGLALQYGGSAGYSGIMANPALGHAVARRVRNGGTAALAETSEICGAENLLTDRAASPEVDRKLVDPLEWWED